MNKSALQDYTLKYYEDNAQAFIAGTLSADMSEARQRFLTELPDSAYILDFGCGSGRDAKVFLELGYQVDAADASEELCKAASEITGITVKKMFFQELNAKETYDGIWACASILHLPKNELLSVLKKIAGALKAQGVLYTSFKYGEFEGMRDGRFYTDFTEETFREFILAIPELHVFSIWLTGDVRPGRKEERWINILARRV